MPTQQLKPEVSNVPRNREERRHPDRLLTIPEAAEVMATSERHVRRLVAERRLAYAKVGYFVRIPQSAIDQFVAAGMVEAVQ